MGLKAWRVTSRSPEATRAFRAEGFEVHDVYSPFALHGVDEAKGVLDRAKKNLDDTIVRAELSGRVGRAMIERGQRVKGSDDVLTTIDVLDPIYVSFWPSAQQQLAWRRDPGTARALAVGGSAKVQAVLADGSTYARLGRIGFIDPVVDQATGTQRYRAEFPNPDRLLLPGQFARIRLLGLSRRLLGGLLLRARRFPRRWRSGSRGRLRREDRRTASRQHKHDRERETGKSGRPAPALAGTVRVPRRVAVEQR